MSVGNRNLREFWFRFQDRLRHRWDRLGHWIESKFDDRTKRDDILLAQRFESDATAIEQASVPLSAHAALYTVLALLLIAVFWSIFGSLDRIVVAQGKVASRIPMIVMQPFTTSRITQIYVKPGDHVRKGQKLASFDPAFAQADQISLEQKVRARAAEVARLEAELGGRSGFPGGLTDDPETRTQVQIFQQEMATYASDLAQRNSRVAQIESQIRAANASIAGLRQQLEYAQKLVSMQQKLQSEQAAATLDVMRAQSNEVEIDLRLKSALGDSRKLVEQRVEAIAERQSYLDRWRSDHSQQLVLARQGLTEAAEALNKARRMKDFTEVTAPVDAIVLEIADRSAGSVLREAETLMTLVPDAADLYVDANVSSRDISYVQVGNKVRVKLEAYPFQRDGTLDGVLEVIGADSVLLNQNDSSQLVYHVQVRLAETLQQLTERGIRLRPGLVATAEITTGKRSIASYVLDPILRTADEGLKEP